MFEPTVPIPAWANNAPPIAGLPFFAQGEQAVRFLNEGARSDGSHPRPPLPEYRFARAAAEAVVA